jgi:CarboxypepD_reg-like domain
LIIAVVKLVSLFGNYCFYVYLYKDEKSDWRFLHSRSLYIYIPNMKLLIILSFLPLYFFGQISYEGKVINAKSKAVISFATIGLMKENIGTNANEDGNFILTSKSNQINDTLIISCVGFVTQKIPLDGNSKTNLVIELTNKVIMFNEIIVKNKLIWSTVTLNQFSKCGNSFITSNGFQKQLAQHFQVEEENSLLTSIKICRRTFALLDPGKTIFRVRIYDMDTLTKSPSTDLCNEIIEVKTKNKIINLNLEKYKIHIPNKDFFVAIEWLKIPFNENKDKTKGNSNEVENTTYSPSIGWTDHTNLKMEAWMLDYNNVWYPMFKGNNKTSISIAATVKY